MPRHADPAIARSPLSPWAVAALVHAVSLPVSLMLALRAPGFMPDDTWCWLEGAGAALLGAGAGLPVWWLPINFLFVPAAHALSGWQVPAPASRD